MPQKQTAIIVVSKSWIDTAVRHLINEGHESRSTGDTHLIFANLEDAADHRGLWLKNVRSTRLKPDGSEVAMRFMIPWGVVIALGIVDQGEPGKPGFAGALRDRSSDSTDQSGQEA